MLCFTQSLESVPGEVRILLLLTDTSPNGAYGCTWTTHHRQTGPGTYHFAQKPSSTSPYGPRGHLLDVFLWHRKQKKNFSSLTEVQDGDPFTKGFLESTAEDIPSVTSLCYRGFLPFPEHSRHLPAPEPSPGTFHGHCFRRYWPGQRHPSDLGANTLSVTWTGHPCGPPPHLRPQRSSLHGTSTADCPCLTTGRELQPRPGPSSEHPSSQERRPARSGLSALSGPTVRNLLTWTRRPPTVTKA